MLRSVDTSDYEDNGNEPFLKRLGLRVRAARAAPAASTFGNVASAKGTRSTNDVRSMSCDGPAPPSAPPATPPPADTAVSFRLVASGVVSDYTPSVRDGIAQSVADAIVGVEKEQVTVTVTAGSVNIAVTIATAAAAATAVTSSLSTHLTTTAAATTLISGSLPSGVSLTVSEVAEAASASALSVPSTTAASSARNMATLASRCPLVL